MPLIKSILNNNNQNILNIISVLLAIIGTIGVSFYLETPLVSGTSSSIYLYIILAALVICWRKLFSGFMDTNTPKTNCGGENLGCKESQSVMIFGNMIFSGFFCIITVICKYIDRNISVPGIVAIFTSIAMMAAIFPISMLIMQMLNRKDHVLHGITYKFSKLPSWTTQPTLLFVIICISWLCVYLAAFPGIYSSDAHTWYKEFNDPTFPISSQWSVIDAGLFYLFVNTGFRITGNYETGFAIFTLLQLFFALAVIWQILKYIETASHNNFALLLTTLFYAIIPLHAIIAVQSVQAAPFMACFGMFIINVSKLTKEKENFWNKRRNIISLIFWGILCGLFRNNALIAFIIFLVFIPFYEKQIRRKLFLAMSIIICSIMIYSGPLLNCLHIQKGTALREMLSIPIQQMACAYCESHNLIDAEDLSHLEEYISSDRLLSYERDPAISDNRKNYFNIDNVRSNPQNFISLYVRIGLQAPFSYIKAFLMQNLGLIYIDKSYPDWRTWHPYINYGSYSFKTSEYITIKRIPLMPSYNKLLSKMFGYATDGYGGDKTTVFSSIPLYSSILRVSTYFWILLWLTINCVIKHDQINLPLHIIIWGYMLTILLSPVILYRYCAPIIFVFPLIAITILGSSNQMS